MPKVILAYARPLMGLPQAVEGQNMLIPMVIVCWNVSLLDESRRDRILP